MCDLIIWTFSFWLLPLTPLIKLPKWIKMNTVRIIFLVKKLKKIRGTRISNKIFITQSDKPLLRYLFRILNEVNIRIKIISNTKKRTPDILFISDIIIAWTVVIPSMPSPKISIALEIYEYCELMLWSICLKKSYIFSVMLFIFFYDSFKVSESLKFELKVSYINLFMVSCFSNIVSVDSKFLFKIYSARIALWLSPLIIAEFLSCLTKSQ